MRKKIGEVPCQEIGLCVCVHTHCSYMFPNGLKVYPCLPCLLLLGDTWKFSISVLIKQCVLEIEFKEYLKFTNGKVDLFQ